MYRERYIDMYISVYMYMYVCVCIYIYIHTHVNYSYGDLTKTQTLMFRKTLEHHPSGKARVTNQGFI